MAIFRGTGGSGDSSTDAYASEVALYAQTALNKAAEATTAATTAAEAEDVVVGIRNEIEGLVDGITQSFFQQATSPPQGSLNEGDLWYNTSTAQFMVYRLVDGMLQWSNLILDNTSDSSDIMDAGSF